MCSNRTVPNVCRDLYLWFYSFHGFVNAKDLQDVLFAIVFLVVDTQESLNVHGAKVLDFEFGIE